MAQQVFSPDDARRDIAAKPLRRASAILVPAAIAHGFRFEPNVTDGWVVSFTEDAAGALTDRAGEALARLRALAEEPVVPAIGDETERARLSALCTELFEEHSLAREGYRLASSRRSSFGLVARAFPSSNLFLSIKPRRPAPINRFAPSPMKSRISFASVSAMLNVPAGAEP